MPSIGISMNGQVFTLNPQTFLYPVNITSGNSTNLYCFLLIRNKLPPTNSPPFVLGIPFFQSFYLQFDYQSLMIGVSNNTISPLTGSIAPNPNIGGGGLSTKTKIILGCCIGGGGLVVIILIILISCCCCKKKKKSDLTTTLSKLDINQTDYSG